MMKIDHSWSTSAKEYIELYRSLIKEVKPQTSIEVLDKQDKVGSDGTQDIKSL
jgi:hypothetical protein